MPRRLEQRIGRVDRIGQSRRVHAIQLVHRDSFESTVIARLDRRRARLQMLAQQPVRNDVDVFASTQRYLRSLAAGGARRQRGVARLKPCPTDGAFVGQGFSLPDCSFADHAAYAVSHRRSSHTLLAFSVSLHDGAGARIARDLIVVDVSHEPTRLSRARVRRLCAHSTVTGAVAVACTARINTAAPVLTATGAAMSRRNEALLRHVAAPARRAAWQDSLFDRRAERQASLRDRARDAIVAHLRRRLAHADALTRLRASAPRLVAAWPGD
jgi:hypothetical protein